MLAGGARHYMRVHIPSIYTYIDTVHRETQLKKNFLPELSPKA